MSELFDRIVDKNLLVRRMYVVANHVLPEADVPKKNDGAVQLLSLIHIYWASTIKTPFLTGVQVEMLIRERKKKHI